MVTLPVFSVSFRIGLVIEGGTGVLIFLPKPALPWPNLGLLWGTPFASEATMGFITCFSHCIFRSNSLPMPCTSGKLMLLDVACDLVWT